MPDSLPANPVIARPTVAIGSSGIAVRSTTDLMEIAAMVMDSNLKPEGIKTKADAFLVMAVGMSWGFDPMMALQTLHIVKGKVGLPGETCAALIQSHPLCRDFRVWFTGDEGDGSGLTAHVQSWRHGRENPNEEITFSWGDAQQAELTNGVNWQHYPKDMLRWKAVARDKKTNWPDVYPGLRVAEDYEPRELEIQVPGAPVRVMRVPELPVLAAEAERSAEFPPEAADSSAPTGAGEEGGESPTESGASGPEPVPPAGGALEPPPLPLPESDPGDPLGDQGMLDLQRKEFAAAVRQRCVQAKRPEKSAELLLKILQKNGFAASKDVPSESWPRLIMQARSAVVPA